MRSGTNTRNSRINSAQLKRKENDEAAMPCTRSNGLPCPPTRYRSRPPETGAQSSSIPSKIGREWLGAMVMCWYQKKMGIAADGQLRSSSLPPTSHVSPLSLLFGELNKLPTFFAW